MLIGQGGAHLLLEDLEVLDGEENESDHRVLLALLLVVHIDVADILVALEVSIVAGDLGQVVREGRISDNLTTVLRHGVLGVLIPAGNCQSLATCMSEEKGE